MGPPYPTENEIDSVTTFSGITPLSAKTSSLNIGHNFLNLIKKHFPKDHKL